MKTRRNKSTGKREYVIDQKITLIQSDLEGPVSHVIATLIERSKNLEDPTLELSVDMWTHGGYGGGAELEITLRGIRLATKEEIDKEKAERKRQKEEKESREKEQDQLAVERLRKRHPNWLNCDS